MPMQWTNKEYSYGIHGNGQKDTKSMTKQKYFPCNL